MSKDLSIIIVNYRSWSFLEPCLKSLQHLPDKYEVVVVDNFSNDGQLESFARNYPQVAFIKSPHNLGYGGACQLGAAHSSGDYFLFLNPDTTANHEAIDSMLDFLNSQNTYGIVSCRQHDNLARHHLLFPNFWRLFGLLKSTEARVFTRRFRIQRWKNLEFIAPDWVTASILMISRKNYEAIGGWSRKLWMYYEDPDLCLRFAALGGRVALLTNRSIHHKHGGATRLNLETTALTRTEVTISRHVYIDQHFSKRTRLLSHIVLIICYLLFGSLLALAGTAGFFVPQLKLRRMIWQRRWQYYVNAFKTKSWLSPRLVIQNGSSVGAGFSPHSAT